MFRSKRRDVVFPQAEHARLAGALALAWGNDAFPRPPLPFDSFVAGVTLHDRGYGELDADGIGEVAPDRWVEIQIAGFEPRGEDSIVDLVTALHIVRLLTPAEHAAEHQALPRLRARLPALHAAAGVDETTAAEADRITDLCDRVAFSFCFEQRAGGSVAVGPATVAYEVDGEGGVTLDPWPLSPAEVSGILLAYRTNGYPEELDPVVVPFRARPG